jgi:hypothetical protein
MKTKRYPLLVIALLIALPALVFPIPESAAIAGTQRSLSEPGLANLTGQVTDRSTGLPVAGALVSVPALALEGATDGDGWFRWLDIAVSEPVIPITVTVQAPGYGAWTLQDVRLVVGDNLILSPVLSDAPYLDIVPPPRDERGEPPSLQQIEALDSLAALPPATLPLPKNIRVRVSGSPYSCSTTRPYTVQLINFKQYAKHVLPNEWGLWPADSLKAGAMAIKMYAWFMIARGGKWKDADVWDSTCDQVYNPNFEYSSMNAAVDAIWDQALSQENAIFPTYYRAYYYQCEDAGLAGKCMGQWDSKDLAEDGYTWDEILAHFYEDSRIAPVSPPAINGYNLRYNADATDYRENRVLIPVDDPNTNSPGPPADVGAESFTIEWWLRADLARNTAPAITCGANENWIQGNILLDREIDGLERGFGASIAASRLAFGVSTSATARLTLCGTSNVADGRWHHIAVERRRSDGYLWLYVDGRLEASADGPNGDLSYPDDHEATLDTDPYLGLGAWKKEADASTRRFFYGWMDELRISNTIRYTRGFTPVYARFVPDANTLALYHFDEGIGDLLTDNAGFPGGASHGSRETGSPSSGGDPFKGSEWAISEVSDIDVIRQLFIPLLSGQPPE